MASTGHGLPDVCQRHGRPSVQRRKITFNGPPPGWSYLLILAGVVFFVIVASMTRKKIVARAWPVCDKCLATRRQLTIGMAVTAVVVVLSFLTRSPGLILLVCTAATLVLIVLVSQRDWRTIQAADVTDDGRSLRLKRPFAGYEQRLPGVPPTPTPNQFDWSTVQPY